MDRKSDRTEYWAAEQDSETFAEEAFKRFEGTPNGIYGNWNNNLYLAYMAYYGSLAQGDVQGGPSSAQLSVTGPQGSVTELNVNWLHSIINSKHQLIVSPELAWTCTPVNGDSKSVNDARRGAKILEYLWKQNNYGQLAKSAVLYSILYGEHFFFTIWDEFGRQIDSNDQNVSYAGDIKLWSVPTWDVLRDCNAGSYDACQWLAVRVPMNKWDLIAKYPDKRDEILANGYSAPVTGPYMNTLTNASSDEDQTVCYFFFHKPTPAVPQGRMAVMLSPECVLDGPMPLPECYKYMPIHRMSSGDWPGAPFGFTSAWEALAPQELATAIQGALATNIISFGHQMISAEEGSNLPVDQIGNGPMVIYRPPGTPPPTALQLTASPPEAYRDLERLYADELKILGINDIVMGYVPADQNASAQAMTVATAVMANSKEQGNYLKFAASVGRSMLKLYQAHATHEQQVALVGVQGPSVPQKSTFTKDDLLGIDDLFVTIDNPMAQSVPGRLAIAQMFKDQGITLVPEQLISVIETGRYEPIIKGVQDEIIYINQENEMLLKGVKPLVRRTDSHQMHIREHKTISFNMEARLSPEVNMALDAHILEHMQMLMTIPPAELEIVGQAAPPQQAPAPIPNAAATAQKSLEGPLAQQPSLMGQTAAASPVDPNTSQPFSFTPKA